MVFSQNLKVKMIKLFIVLIHYFFDLCVEDDIQPIKYKKIFSDLSDIEIPSEILSIGMELGEGTVD